MPQSFAALTVHVVFSTKQRQPFIGPDLQPRLYAYCGGVLEGSGRITGVEHPGHGGRRTVQLGDGKGLAGQANGRGRHQVIERRAGGAARWL